MSEMIPNAARRAPHQGNQSQAFHHAPNAALLIDFDNVTMGIRSDLGKELKSLLNSEVIRGKVAVQRAYADWRRYPQYIVPLAESSIDLIFAPAYGSAKKNATDLRMAIDAIELVFTRPEIGTYILMTGDSDFSSCVLKLKEYGKYVIGVGMRESSSDLLIQNCDEYYSYHALSGLTRTDEVTESKEDPWVLLKRAAQQMAADRDVMRTDRLKQVMLDLDPAFDEKKIGYSKFSRFVQEGASKGIIRLRKMENGQHEIGIDGAPAVAAGDGAARPAPRESSNGRGRGRGRGRDRERDESRREAPTPPAPIAPAPEAATPQAAVDSAPAEQVKEEAVSAPAPQASAPAPQQRTGRAPASRPAAATESATAPAANDLEGAYGLLQQALRELGGTGGKTIRDGDVKRKMLDLSPDFDESRLGFPKFTRFLRQAHDAEAIDLKRAGAGNYEVAVGSTSRKYAAPAGAGARRGSGT
ncbi:MAG: NYN domain-containing protein, partial [Gemmatimonadetes bacterium]|nr:NYN domain-containing protein [Gemmatimonadota bacterium]